MDEETAIQERVYAIVHVVVHVIVGPVIDLVIDMLWIRQEWVDLVDHTILSGSLGENHSQPYDVSLDLRSPLGLRQFDVRMIVQYV